MADADSPLFRFQLWRAGLPPALRALLTVNLATYVLYVLLSIVGAGEWLRVFALPLSPREMLVRPWSVLTYGVTNVYPGFFGLISFGFGALWLNWLGRDYEETYGSHRLLGLYVFGTLGGAALAAILGAVVSGGAGGLGLGVWAGIWAPLLAVLCGIATLQPNRGIGLFLLGVVPLKWIAIGFVVLELAFSKDPTHLGAALFGFLFAKAQQNGLDLAGWARPIFDRRGRTRTAPRSVRSVFTRSAPAAKAPASSRTAGRAGTSARGARDIDQILDKILEKGYDSLTPEERKILDEASRD